MYWQNYEVKSAWAGNYDVLIHMGSTSLKAYRPNLWRCHPCSIKCLQMKQWWSTSHIGSSNLSLYPPLHPKLFTFLTFSGLICLWRGWGWGWGGWWKGNPSENSGIHNHEFTVRTLFFFRWPTKPSLRITASKKGMCHIDNALIAVSLISLAPPGPQTVRGKHCKTLNWANCNFTMMQYQAVHVKSWSWWRWNS